MRKRTRWPPRWPCSTTYVEEGITARLHALGERLAAGVRDAAAGMGVGDHVVVRGRASNLVFATLDENRQPSQRYRTLFLRQLLAGGVLAPSFVVSSALSDADIDRTIDVVAQACAVYRKALDAGDPATLAGRATSEAGVPPPGVTPSAAVVYGNGACLTRGDRWLTVPEMRDLAVLAAWPETVPLDMRHSRAPADDGQVHAGPCRPAGRRIPGRRRRRAIRTAEHFNRMM